MKGRHITIRLIPVSPPTTPLHEACKRGDVEEARRWIRKRPDMVLVEDEHKRTALQYCGGSPTLKRMLWDAGAEHRYCIGPNRTIQVYDNAMDEWSDIDFAEAIRNCNIWE